MGFELSNQGLGQVLPKLGMGVAAGSFELQGILLRQYRFLRRQRQWASGIRSRLRYQILCLRWLANLEGETKVVGDQRGKGRDDLESLATLGERGWCYLRSS